MTFEGGTEKKIRLVLHLICLHFFKMFILPTDLYCVPMMGQTLVLGPGNTAVSITDEEPCAHETEKWETMGNKYRIGG